ncbi:polysaccharide deacetylase family protein [Paenibacillus glycanilyticus]|uniref:polysaccharide deacetylase family protein n=1 Tax=Paenibacillus glycanilyticus TaxID=126569 RepID=UPI003EB6D5F6
MPRQELPQNYVANSGQLLEGFDNATEWSVLNGTVQPDYDHYKTGTSSLKFITDSSGNAGASKNISLRLDKDGQFQISLYIPDDPDNIDHFDIYLTSKSDYGSYFYISIYDRLFKGWNTLTFGKEEFYNENGEQWTNSMIRLRIRLFATTGCTATVSFDDLRNQVVLLPRITVTFDDGWKSSYDYGIQYMNAKGLKGTMYIISNLVGSPDFMSLAECVDCYEKGWALGNHTMDHLDLATLTPSEIQSQLLGCTEWLDTQGFSRASRHVAYPFGGYNEDVLAAMDELDMLTGRTVLGGFHCTFPPLSPHELVTLNVTPDTTLEELRSRVDWAMSGKGMVNFLFHELVAGIPVEEIQYPIEKFQAFADYLAERRAITATIDEWYEGLTNPRYRSLPLIRTTV